MQLDAFSIGLDSIGNARKLQRHLKRHGVALENGADEKSTWSASLDMLDQDGGAVLIHPHRSNRRACGKVE